jgi:hypothetical protein
MNRRSLLHASIALLGALAFATPSSARQRGPIAPVARPGDTAQAAPIASTRPLEVRVVYYSGDVSLHDTAGDRPVALGVLVDSLTSVAVGRNASVQLAVDGRLVVLDRPGMLRRSEIVRRAGGEANEELMAALRSLAGQDEILMSAAMNPARVHAAIAAAMAPSARGAGTSVTGTLIPLEPRATAVTRGPLRFRWLRSADSTTYHVVVRDRFDNEVFRGETADTFMTWESADLFVGSEYTWTLSRSNDSIAGVTSTFHRLDDLQGMRLEGGESRIRIALGSENPALPIVLGAHFALHGCYADAARQYTTAALRTPEHFDRFLRLARELYASKIGLSSTELEHVQTLGAMTMN